MISGQEKACEEKLRKSRQITTTQHPRYREFSSTSALSEPKASKQELKERIAKNRHANYREYKPITAQPLDVNAAAQGRVMANLRHIQNELARTEIRLTRHDKEGSPVTLIAVNNLMQTQARLNYKERRKLAELREIEAKLELSEARENPPKITAVDNSSEKNTPLKKQPWVSMASSKHRNALSGEKVKLQKLTEKLEDIKAEIEIVAKQVRDKFWFFH